MPEMTGPETAGSETAEGALPKAKVAVLISGSGTNMAALLYASRQPDAAYEIVLVASNDPAAGGLRLAEAEGVPTFALSHKGMERAAHDAAMDTAIRGSGAEYVGVTPDIMNTAKQITNGAVPLGAVIASREIYQTFMQQPAAPHMIEFSHGYTYSAHPVACAAGLATLQLMQQEQLVQQAAELAPQFADKLHGLKGSRYLLDIRNCGLAGALQLAPRDGDAVIRPYEAGLKLWQAGFYVRFGGDCLQFGPTFNTRPEQLDSLFNAVGDVLNSLD